MEAQPFVDDLLTRTPLRRRHGVYEFVGDHQDYATNFGMQWTAFRSIQIDSSSGLNESETRFVEETGWTPDMVKDKLLLDAGCGAGRFAEIAVKYGARVVAVDLSEAVYACDTTLSGYPTTRYAILRASLDDLPLKDGIFDGIYALGVLHHTPDPLGSLQALCRHLKPGGRLATWIYEKKAPDISAILPRTWLRRLTRGWSLSKIYRLSQGLTAVFFPAGWLVSWLGRPGEALSSFLPYAARHHRGRGDLKRQWDYCLMDTIDWYGPRYDSPQRERDVTRAMEEAGLVDIRRLPARGMAIIGEKAAADATHR